MCDEREAALLLLTLPLRFQSAAADRTGAGRPHPDPDPDPGRAAGQLHVLYYRVLLGRQSALSSSTVGPAAHAGPRAEPVDCVSIRTE